MGTAGKSDNRGARIFPRSPVALINALAVLSVPFWVAAPMVALAASDASGLDPREETALVRAARENNDVALNAIVIAAIARDMDNASDIIADLHRLAPAEAPDVVARAAAIFPDIQLDMAADDGAPTAADETDTVASDSGPTETPSTLYGEMSVGGSYLSGVSSAVNGSLAGRVVSRSVDWTHSLRGNFDYGRADGTTNTRRHAVRARSQYDFSDRFYGFGIATYHDDRFSGYDYQVTEGGGIGYRLFDGPDFTFDFEAGPALRQSKKSDDGDLANELLGRLGIAIDWAISDNAQLSNETSLFVGRSEVTVVSSGTASIEEQAQARNLTALDLQVVEDLSARLSYEFRYLSNPPPAGTATTSLVSFALVHDF
ncbi:DUF481 domain-containing protein [Oceanibacterium hippocampi]|uniref:Salt-induced outer membrane protein n=1 Tax=Oceanibacterium hippocampi TaxID=745714 RepID=A0A1Y5U2S3_9PROT|nr:DUF481 domain-containing protein [Oceanibacterium hippocampi]SLN75776.1 hypothetical protein OCH7691_03956 [Oceanibacterium hippocampi]